MTYCRKDLSKEEREQIFREVAREHNIKEAREYCKRFLYNNAIDSITEEEVEQDLNKMNFEEMAWEFEQKMADYYEVEEMIMDVWCDVTDHYMFHKAGLDENKYDI